jgi:hypothetical protein
MTREGEGSRRRQGCGGRREGLDRPGRISSSMGDASAGPSWPRDSGGHGTATLPAADGADLDVVRRWSRGRPLVTHAHGGALGGYDELGMVAHTVLRYHPHLLTEFERKAIVAFDGRWRVALARDPEVMHHQLRLAGVFDTPGLGAVMSRGYEAFCRDIAARVLFEHASDLVLNRCPRCDRIVRTPTARQCLWCFHDWH